MQNGMITPQPTPHHRLLFCANLHNFDPLQAPPPQEMHWKGGRYPPLPFRTLSLRPATVSLTASASFNGTCNRQ